MIIKLQLLREDNIITYTVFNINNVSHLTEYVRTNSSRNTTIHFNNGSNVIVIGSIDNISSKLGLNGDRLNGSI